MKLDLYLYTKKRESKLTQEEFAKKIGISKRMLYNILQGHDTTGTIISRIIKETGGQVTLEDLIVEKSKKNKSAKQKTKKNDPKTNSLKRRGG